MNPVAPATDAALLPPAILLAGPTAAGKTALALALVDRLAEHFPCELVSVDSAQVFIGMDVGTAKPDAAVLARYPHHLIDLITPQERYSAGRFLADARRTMDDIVARGRVPLLVGGTMLYFKVLLEGIAALPAADPELRRAIDEQAARLGWPALHAELARLDPAAAAQIDPRHSHRIQRALELVRLTGRPLAELHAGDGEAGVQPPPACRMLALALFPENRADLHGKIEQRFHQMLDGGLVDELAGLRRRYDLTPELPSMRCVGYRQAWDYLDGTLDRRGLVAQGVAATRQLAKRQLTWLRSLPFTRLDPAAPDLIDQAWQHITAHCTPGTALPPSRRNALRSQNFSGNATLQHSDLPGAAP